MKEDSTGKVQVALKVQEKAKNGTLKARGCTHIDQIQVVTPSAVGCEDCLKSGDSWVHLRLCLTCGYVGCCDSSKNKHASRHAKHANHPIIVSYEPDEYWLWCYVDEVGFLP